MVMGWGLCSVDRLLVLLGLCFGYWRIIFLLVYWNLVGLIRF